MDASELLLYWANGATMQQILDAHAHQLAEKIRIRACAKELYGLDTDTTIHYGLLDAADLIDPEKGT
jgi:hypothetical protein